jgi:hypothetical protein
MLYHVKSVDVLSSVFIFFILSILCIPLNHLYAGSQPQKTERSAQINYLGGKERIIHQPSFVYDFVYNKDKEYYNPPHYQKRALGFAYNESVTRDPTKGIIIAIGAISFIEFQWEKDKSYFFRPREVVLAFKKGDRISIKGTSLEGLSSKYLCGTSEAMTTQGKVFIEGFEITNGNRQPVSGILAYHANYDAASTVAKIIFK